MVMRMPVLLTLQHEPHLHHGAGGRGDRPPQDARRPPLTVAPACGFAGASPSSFHVSGSIGLGLPSISDVALAVFGNAITSRMLSRPPSSMMMRSRPMPMPPCGGDA